ncbi:hypothetical protein DICPUDRAFT_153876 [Dictyostelium purpureum]|uniref:MJ1316 RNA cyclic group end recognition domain-containing protein n=1 Tax=Dictyostelium purpureum TaxID=5786 RepID=F0ZPY9_DICPU|nr:uncharacterized protein DICPUDRAFT_153876 [Dictyostelium purpureum]EGC33989.1 hypothetical protein DICPUDRAFT_153876 [Dictyostelium purpureum]|eukprot:XP_003289475.1 hypothetical protein DICPUDRAFT_153876 [Dictyostelium purpureum]
MSYNQKIDINNLESSDESYNSSSDEKALEDLEKEEQQERLKRKANRKNTKKTATKLTTEEEEEILKKETENCKKERLPSSEEIYNRIKFDIPEGVEAKNHIKDFTICYIDRFSSHLMSISYPEFEYGVVPLHRIQLFKYKDTIVWDRQQRFYQFPNFLEQDQQQEQQE